MRRAAHSRHHALPARDPAGQLRVAGDDRAGAENGKRESRRLALFFNDGKLARIEGDVASPAAGR
jgi:hypothetical protein